MEFPRLVYRSAAVYTQATDKNQFDSLIKDGWFASVPDAISGKSAPTQSDQADDSEPTRQELEQKAIELGIKFDGRTTDAKLAARIAETIG